MSEKQETHTPGQWSIEDCTPGESTGLCFAINSENNVIARTTDGWKEAQANARLIASAPDMLEMCKLFEECMANLDGASEPFDTSYELSKVRAVLAKVEGESA
tara:strand:+ start:608 stop:916 length:309 start_codon:yes stop_codon:yes gene_type:complete